jgi:limonene-1,2-epoxide hydrolase
MPMPKTPEEVAHAFVAAINAEDPNALHDLMAEDHTFTDALGNSFSGADKMRFGWQHFFRAYPGYRINIQHTFAAANRVALFGDANGGWRVDDIVLPQRWTVSAAWLAEVENEQIRHWTVFCDTSWANPPRSTS